MNDGWMPIYACSSLVPTYRLFGVVIEAADGEAQVWHPDVSASTEQCIALQYSSSVSRVATRPRDY